MFRQFIEHVQMRAKQNNAKSTWRWMVSRIVARLGNDLFIFLWRMLFAWLPSLPGKWVRRIVLSIVLKECGKGIKVGENVHIEYPRRIHIGNNVRINRNCHLSGAGEIYIADHVMLAHRTIIETAGHEIVSGELFHKTPIIYGKVKIGSNTWCGTRTTILYNTNIGKNSVIAAGAVVITDIPSNVIAGGVPAKVIRELTINNSNETTPNA